MPPRLAGLHFTITKSKNMIKPSISVFSNSFKNKNPIPKKYTCDSLDISPHFSWANIPQETKSFIVMAFDKDMPLRGLSLFTWIHWLVYDILPEIMELDEGFPNNASFENGTKQGITTFRKPGYGGPCPPFGKHRYFFRVLAIALNLKILQTCPYIPFRRNHRFFLKSFAVRRGAPYLQTRRDDRDSRSIRTTRRHN